MQYIGESDFRHDDAQKLGILFVNLGTPDAPDTAASRRFLSEFLWDPRVIEIPRLLWWLILHLIILRVRPKKVAKMYQKIWTSKGSPLLVNSKSQLELVTKNLSSSISAPIECVLAMRYGNPSLLKAMQQLHNANVRRVLVVPLYPQYSSSTTASIYDAVSVYLKHIRWIPEMRFVNNYADMPDYIDACVKKIKQHWQKEGRGQKLVLSFHGLPKKSLMDGDPYHCQCHLTSRLIAESLGISPKEWITTFQSRFGRQEWLKPYTDECLQEMPQNGITSIDIFCPGFSSDCLETLEEINIQNREIFLKSGGDRFSYIEALNSSEPHIQAISNLVLNHIQGWPESTNFWDSDSAQKILQERKKRALTKGADK